ncbi:uncharacterized protein LOC129717004 [Wyeomyia smithii]|uniref:uncharacterized protein LOC129717004 n=1 Tax=Wyeomyia smithii TaxID=174621 RepID=UPI002467DF97|nr:uncharacterized protein LOC129717004 [Wyeomyia smithii]
MDDDGGMTECGDGNPFVPPSRYKVPRVKNGAPQESTHRLKQYLEGKADIGIPLYHLIANLESILRKSNEKTVQDRNRSLVVNKIQNFLSRSKRQHNKNPLSQFCCRATKTTKEFLRKNPEVCALESDKGKRMVVIYTKEYDQNMEALLDSPTLLNLKLIDTTTATRLRTYTAICPRIYRQPKAHKAELPLQPVVPNITAPTYALSKYVTNRLQQAFTSKYNISDSFREIYQHHHAPDYVIVSFDFVSLFTNVPQDLIMQTIIYRWPSIKEKTSINLNLFPEMVEFCLKCSYFQFRGKYYLQQTGTAMGSPLSPFLADMVMEDLICNAARKLSFTPPVLKKYVDDLILALPKQETLNTLGIFNDFHPNLQFTMEEDSNGALPYLDTKVIRSAQQTLSKECYSKPIASGCLLNFHSFHPLSMKINVASNFIQRVTSLTTNNPSININRRFSSTSVVTATHLLSSTASSTEQHNRFLNRQRHHPTSARATTLLLKPPTVRCLTYQYSAPFLSASSKRLPSS